MNQPLALACANSASEQDLIDIADHDISKVIIPLSGVRAGHIEKLQDKMLIEKGWYCDSLGWYCDSLG